MNEDLEQQRGEASEPPSSERWAVLPVPAEVCHAAFEAWVHVPTGTTLLKLWIEFVSPVNNQRYGHWLFEVRHPSGRRGGCMTSSNESGPLDVATLFGCAEAAIADIEGEMQQGG